MDILLFVLLGFLAGWLASIIMGQNERQGFLTDVLLGIAGAIVGGYVMNFFGNQGVQGFNLYSLVVATIGAVALIAIGRTVFGSLRR